MKKEQTLKRAKKAPVKKQKNQALTSQDKEYREYIQNKIQEFNSNGKQTIVYFCDTFYPIIDGVIKVLDNYAARLSEKYNVVVVIPKHKNEIVKKDYLVIGVVSLYFKFVNYDLAFPDIDSYLSKTLKNLRVDIVHSHSPFNMGQFAAKYAKSKKVPFVMTMHSQYKRDFERYTGSDLITSYLLRQVVKVFSKSVEVFAMHEKIKNELIDYGYKGKFYMIPNATDHVPSENPKQLCEQTNEKYNLGKNEFVMLFVGRLVAQKNIFFIANVLKRLKESGRNFKMFFVGTGPDEKELKEKIKKYDLKDSVIFTGQLTSKEELAAIYTRANLFIFPSTYDASSIVQIEAATYKTPGLFIDGSVTACTVTNNQNGFTAPLDEEAYTNRIIQILQSKTLLEKVSENAFRELYVPWERVIDMADKRYQYLIEENKKKIAEKEKEKSKKRKKLS